jgi:hypothetical protein
MKVEQIKISRYHRKRSVGLDKTGKITVFTTDKAELTIEQHDKLLKFLETL